MIYTMMHTYCIGTLLLLSVARVAHTQCLYSDVDLSLYTCIENEGIFTEYALPYMSTSDADTFCGASLTTIKSCASEVISNCSSNTNVTKFFGSSGSYLTSAYTYLCNQYSSNTPEPFNCSNDVNTATIKTNLTSFSDTVDALTSPTLNDICTAATTLENDFKTELTNVCGSYPTSKKIWIEFMRRFTLACPSSSGLHVASVGVMLITGIALMLF